LVDTDRGRQYTLYTEPAVANDVVRNYVAKYGDTFEMLATRIYSDPTQWWRIANLNPHLFFPDPIPAGAVVRVPVS
jgi:nucleoid-associated protein YgaU